MTEQNIHTVRQLTEKFFNATISQKESKVLADIARDLAGDNPTCRISDMQLLQDLKVVAMLNECASATLQAFSLKTPQGLEQRLSNHISSLAADTRRKRFRRIILPAAGVAAAATLLISVGVNMRFGAESETPLSPSLYSENSAPSTVEETSSNPIPNIVAEAAPVIAKSSTPVIKNGVTNKRKNVSYSPATSSPVIMETEIKIPESIELPTFSDPVLEVIPAIAAATIDPSQLALQPLSTLSQTVCNIYESADMVATALAGISETFEMVNSSLSMLPTLSDNLQ